MAIYQSLIVSQVHNDSTYRSFMSATIAAVESVGWVNTYASGSVNTGSATWRPLVADFDYVIFRANDAFQGTSPVFLRMQFGRQAAGATNVRVQTQIGFRTQGDLLAGPTSSFRETFTPPTRGTGSIDRMLVSGDSGRLSICYSPDNPVAFGGSVFSLSRGRDITGSINPDQLHYVIIHTVNTSNTYYTYVTNLSTPAVDPVFFTPNLLGANLPFHIADDSIGDTTTATWFEFDSAQGSLLCPTRPNVYPVPELMALKRKYTDQSNDIVTIPIYNAPVNYLNVGNTYNFNSVVATGEANLLMRWE